MYSLNNIIYLLQIAIVENCETICINFLFVWARNS